MKNMSDKAKRGFIISAGILLCIVLVFMIGARMQKEPVEAVPVQETSNEVEEVSIDYNIVIPTVENESAETEEVVVEPIDIVVPEEDEGVADDTGTEQTIQPDIPEKPTYTEEQLTDSTQTPDGLPVDPPQDDETGSEEVVQTPIETVSSTEPQGGDTSNGQIYLPGFGWVDDEGGGGEGTKADDMYENGNKIGDMN